jgi:phosphoribosylanthranilate isomerase
VWVKICGITRLEDAVAASQFGADAIGFIFAPGPRRVSVETARAISSSVKGQVSRVGVFVDADREDVERVAEYCGLDAVQLHGKEEPGFCESLSVEVIKAFRISRPEDVREAASYSCDRVLLDGYFGSGNGKPAYSRQDVELFLPRRQVVVAGGLDSSNVKETVGTMRPFGVDVASGVESSPGIKDPVLLYRFIEKARRANYEVIGN